MDKTEIGLIVAILSLPLAWMTHCMWWISLMSSGDMAIWQGVLAVLGAVAFPIGIAHGYLIWFQAVFG